MTKTALPQRNELSDQQRRSRSHDLSARIREISGPAPAFVGSSLQQESLWGLSGSRNGRASDLQPGLSNQGILRVLGVDRALVLRRACACGGSGGAGAMCSECAKKEELQRSPVGPATSTEAPASVHHVLRSPGQTLDRETRAFFESCFGKDFSSVRIHSDSRAAESARAVSALAYAVGNHVVFGEGLYSPGTRDGRNLLAHELTHTLQQCDAHHTPGAALTIGSSHDPAEREAEHVVSRINSAGPLGVRNSSPPQVSRSCTPSSVCNPGGVPGSATGADTAITAAEAPARARRKAMSPARAVSTGHAGRATAAEAFMQSHQPGRLAVLQGVFIDHDMDPGEFAGLTQDCGDWIAKALPAGSPTPPGMAGATKPCTFVHGELNQHALTFNTDPTAATIGGLSRELWRVNAVQLLIHESGHIIFENVPHATPSGITSASCTPASVQSELSEITAILSEFPAVSRSAATEASPTGPLHTELAKWFRLSIRDGGENIKSALAQMGCSCECPEVDAFVGDTFNFASGAANVPWTLAEKDAFHREIRRPVWGVRWPLAPSTP